ncbi:MAG: hypothetical protein N2255_02885 [Kiritimatiellae bacterium]|nr:hypothetical protein [Kiritimatiellia bacterium]
MNLLRIHALFLALTFSGFLVAVGETFLLCGFEDRNELAAWDCKSGKPDLSTEAVTQGAKALRILFDPAAEYFGAYLTWRRVHRDWSRYDALVLDVWNPLPHPVDGYTLIADEAWAEKGRSYWNRHNAHRRFPPGRSQWVIPVQGLYRGEAGSRNNDIKTDIDASRIVRLDFGFGRKGTSGQIIIDNLRLVKSERPSQVWAFDFGPSSQAVMPGWTAISHSSRYSDAHGYGWGPQGGTPWNGAARDTTFGPALLRDFCEGGGYNFTICAPPGRYRFVIFYENSGYWSGEQARHRTRRILVNGNEVWSETRPDGETHALYRFEDVEPVGVDLWSAYMAAELARPVIFEAETRTEKIALRFESDRVWGSKIAAVVVYRADDTKAAAWVEDQLKEVENEFRSVAVCLDAPAVSFEAPEPWQQLGVIVWPVRIEDDVLPGSTPSEKPRPPGALEMVRTVAAGEEETFCFAIRGLRDVGRCHFSASPFRSKGGHVVETGTGLVFYKPHRGFEDIAWSTRADTIRNRQWALLQKDVTREVIITARVSQQASPGEYSSRLVINEESGKELVSVPLKLVVSPVRLSRETDFLMGFFGILPPDLLPESRREEVLDSTLALLHRYGINAVSGGPCWQLKGWRDGQPVIDFSAMDRFVKLLKKHGFTRPINAYGGSCFEGLHSGYMVGDAGERVSRQSGLQYDEALRRCWAAVDQHRKEAGWPLLYYCLCDETRVRETAEQELAFMRMMKGISAAFPETLRTSGAYSVTFRRRPTSPDDLLYWHQRFFETLDVSNLNAHDESVLEEGRRLGKEVHVYNQGRSRYSFGLYQWCEYRKGVRARWEWHLNILHGYQFFDLDGREPDTAMICYGREAIYPTIHLERIREGIEDFYLYLTLLRELERRRGYGARGGSVSTGETLLTRLDNMVALNQREVPPGFDADVLKFEVLKAIEKLQGDQTE